MRILKLTVLSLLILGLAATGGFAQGELSEEEAQAKIKEYRDCEEEANLTIAEEGDKVDALEAEIAELNDRIAAVKAEIADLKKKKFDIYEVKEGDWLSKLAEYPQVYGRGNYRRWPDIYRANKDLIKDPDLIYPGWKLKVPKP